MPDVENVVIKSVLDSISNKLFNKPFDSLGKSEFEELDSQVTSKVLPRLSDPEKRRSLNLSSDELEQLNKDLRNGKTLTRGLLPYERLKSWKGLKKKPSAESQLILAKYLGFSNWKDYTKNGHNKKIKNEDVSSKEVITVTVNKSIKELVLDPPPGARLRIVWVTSVVIVLISSVSFFYIVNSLSSADLVEKYLSETYDAPFVIRGDSTPNWVNYYKGRQFEKALSELRSIDKISIQRDFYIGLCLMYSQDWLEATDQLMPISKTSSIFQEQANWYLALAHWKAGNYKASKTLLEHIVNNKTYQHEGALKILER